MDCKASFEHREGVNLLAMPRRGLVACLIETIGSADIPPD
jgi:hypothetical protein